MVVVGGGLVVSGVPEPEPEEGSPMAKRNRQPEIRGGDEISLVGFTVHRVRRLTITGSIETAIMRTIAALICLSDGKPLSYSSSSQAPTPAPAVVAYAYPTGPGSVQFNPLGGRRHSNPCVCAVLGSERGRSTCRNKT